MRYTRFNLQGIFHCWIFLSFCITLFLFGAKVNAQTAGTASIQGVVTDATGAVVQNATVTATNIDTQVKHATATSGSGLYSLPNIPIGTYNVEVSAQGFEHYRQTNIVLEVGSSIAVNPALKIGQTNVTVEVESSGLALQTEDSSLKQTIDQSTMTEMPLNGRQMTSLITLTGGAVNANENNDESGSKTFYSSAVISIGGGQGNATDYRLDGADQNDYMTNVNLPFPFPDAVAEFSVETAALGAQSGLHPGGLVNVVTRSGSNQWHGSGFEFIRNNYINATNFFSTKKDILHQNQFGGTFGGKIIRDKLFGFVGYQHEISNNLQSNTTAYVPTAANLLGDFSASDVINSATGAGQLYDPQTGIKITNNNYNDPASLAAGLKWTVDPKAKALTTLFPTSTAANGLVTFAIPVDFTENQFVTRVDSTLTSNHSLYGRYFLDGYKLPTYYSPTNILITANAGNNERAQGFTLGETYIISKSLVNSAHATVTRRRNDRGPAATGINYGDLGNGALTTTAPATSVFYDLTSIGSYFTATSKWNVYCSKCSSAFFNVNTLSLADDVNWMHGKHQISFGGEFVRTQLNVSNVYEGDGFFTFSGNYSKFGPTGTKSTTNSGLGIDANLDFLTGSMSGFTQSKAQQNAMRQPIPSAYIQDTYHATSKLVLNAGVRWDPEYVATDYFNRGSVFNYDAFVAGTVSSVYTNAPAGSFFHGDKGVPKAFTQNSPWQFSPRVGATYDPRGNGKTVFRVGGALVYDSPNLFTSQRVQQNPPFGLTVANTAGSTPLSFDSPWSNGSVTTNPFPEAPVPSSSFVFPKGGQYFVLPSKFHSPYTIQYTASVQHEFGHGWQAEIDYNGNRTDFGPYGLPMNPAVYISGSDCSSNAKVTPTHGAGTSPCSTTANTAMRYKLTLANSTAGPYYAGGGTTGGIGSGAGSVYVMAGANASYNGMIASIQHRMSSNFVLMANYTWSHCIDISDNAADVSTLTIQNPANIKGDKGNCGFDFRHVINTTVVASSHFNSLHGLLAATVNHWEISPLMHITDGAPFTVMSGQDNSLIAEGGDRPDRTGSPVYTHNKIKSGASTNAQYINTAAFKQNAQGTFGNSGQYAYRGPKFLQIDSALTRSFALHKALKLDLRIESFNVLNHPDFAAPGSSAGYLAAAPALTSSTFGRITSTANGSNARLFQGAVKLTF
jgi:hypothetical protein